MRVLGFDLETSGLDTAKDRIIEVGFCLWDVPTKRPLVLVDTFLHDSSYPPVPEIITKITGITQETLEEFGSSPKSNFETLEAFCAKHKPDYLVGHNLVNFDAPFLYAELTRNGVEAPCLRSLPLLDTRTDIPFADEPDSRKLKHLALDIGVINPFPHRAISDVLTMMLVLSHYDIQEVLKFQKIPFVLLRAIVSFADKDLAKARRFQWEKIGERVVPKCWIKLVKANVVDQEISECKKAGFQAAVIA